MKKHCVNHKNKDVVDLANSLGIHPAIAASKIAIWQDKNGLDKFPTVDELSQTKEVNYQKNQTVSNEGLIASEKTIRDLAARIADRIGMKVKFESDRSKEYKGKIENNIAYINLAYATLDTPIHEILGHPIIRALKNGKELTGATFSIKDISNDTKAPGKFELSYYSDETLGDVAYFDTKEEAEKYASSLKASNGNPQLYQNLLKELETGRGKEVLDRIKRDYNLKSKPEIIEMESLTTGNTTYEINGIIFNNKEEAFNYQKEKTNFYTLEEQQEEAIVELLGLMTAEKLDNVKDGKLISLLKRLLKEMKQFVRSLLNQREVEIDKLPDNMTLGDLSDLLAYSNSKLILPGYEVEYTTPDNEKFKTYQEASNHISELSKNVKDVDLNNIKVNVEISKQQQENISNLSKKINDLKEKIKNFIFEKIPFNNQVDIYTPKGRLRQNYWARNEDGTTGYLGGSPETLIEPEYDGFVIGGYDKDIKKSVYKKISNEEAKKIFDNINDASNATKKSKDEYNNLSQELFLTENKLKELKTGSPINNFIEKNKEYEQSKEIIEEWKKVNNIQYNPEEIYSRGQEFSSVVGAYSNFDVDLMMQNLLSHIEDNEKAGGKFAISAYTKPIDKQIGHLEGGGGKIKFKLYPKSNDILWAANTDVYSGSVWDASEKVNKDKKSELLGVSYTKYPSLRNVNTVQPNLASIVDDLNHHHNELGIVLTGNNFRLEYDEDIPYTTKKIIDGINKILDQKYGKLIKPEINILKNVPEEDAELFDHLLRLEQDDENSHPDANALLSSQDKITLQEFKKLYIIQPTQTNDTLKESIEGVKSKFSDNFGEKYLDTLEVKDYTDSFEVDGEYYDFISYNIYNYGNSPILDELVSKEPSFKTIEEAENRIKELIIEAKKIYEDRKNNKKEYTSQALINTKIAALKEVAKKQPRSLIRSEVKPISQARQPLSYFEDDMLFQKLPSPINKIDNNRDESTIYAKVDFNNLVDESAEPLIQETVKQYHASEINRILFDNKQGKFTVDEILENILNNYKNLSPIGREFLEKSRRLVGRTGAKIQFVSENQLIDKNTVMQIDSSTNTIQINRQRLGNFTTDEVVESFLHELAHAQTLQALLNPITFEEKEFAKLIKEYFIYYKSKNINNSIVLSNLRNQIYQAELDSNSELVNTLSKKLNSLMTYGFLNEKEFVAEIYANSAFREELKALDKENNTSYWKQFIDAVRRLFGLAKSKESDLLIEQVIDFIEQDRRDYRGTNLQRIIFQKRLEPDSKFTKLEDKLNEVIKKAQDKIEQVYKRTTSNKNHKSDEDKKRHAENIKELINDLDKYSTDKQWQAIISYTKAFNKTTSQVESLLDKMISTKDVYEDDLGPLIDKYEEYLASYDLLDEIEELMSASKLEFAKMTDEDKDAINEIKSSLKVIKSNHADIKETFLQVKKAQLIKTYSDPKYNTETETKWRKSLTTDYNNLADKNGQSLNEYISTQLTDNDEYKADLRASAERLINDPSIDITMLARKISDPLNTKSRVIQIMMNIIGEARDKVNTAFRDRDLKFEKLYSKFIKEKGNKKPSELNKNIVEKDSEGNGYLLGKYSLKFKDLYDSELQPLIDKRKELVKSELEKGTKEAQIKQLPEYKILGKQMATWFKANTIKNKAKETIPHPKFLNIQPTGIDLEMLNEYKSVDKENEIKFKGQGSLIRNIFGAEFHRLPSITKTDLERRIEADVKGLWKDKVSDFTNIKPDDIGMQTKEEALNARGQIIRDIKVHYRGQIDPTEQSYDLATMYRKEFFNGINYAEKSKIRPTLHMIADVVKGKDYYKKSSRTGEVLRNKFNLRSPEQNIKGEFTNEYNRILGILERNLYDTFSEHGGTFLGADVNKISNSINGYAAGVSMAFNLASGTANIANGFTQLFIESFGGSVFNKSSLIKAEAKYTKDLPNIFADLTNPVNKSYTNQLLEMFDVFGGLDPAEQDSIRNNFVRKFGSTKMLNFLNESGEHAMHGVLTMAILDSVKVMNSDKQHIDKDGKVTTEAKAASMLDMLTMVEGKLTMNPEVVYSARNLVTPYNEGGKTHINLLIKKKTFDIFGVYDVNFKNEVSKHWFGKSVMMFKNFFISGMQYRYRGFDTSLKKSEDLTDDDMFYSSAEKEYIEGTYTTLIRFFRHGVIPNLKSLHLAYQNYKNLSEFEKANLKRATLEIFLTAVILPSIGLLLAGADPDRDDEELWFAIYLTRRLESELSQFRNPIEASRLIQNPIAGIRIVQNSLNFVYDIATPFNLIPNDEKGQNFFSYLDEDSKGKNKLGKTTKKLIPIVSQLEKNYQQMYNLQYNK